MHPEFIVWHTAASYDEAADRVVDLTVEQVRDYHVNRLGWRDIGYHAYVRLNGDVHIGRPQNQRGAHVAGLNSRSLGLCFAGHGDLMPLTPYQLSEGIELTMQWMRHYSIDVRNVIGHREVNELVEQGVIGRRYRTTKTCPGRLVDMDHVRAMLYAKQLEL